MINIIFMIGCASVTDDSPISADVTVTFAPAVEEQVAVATPSSTSVPQATLTATATVETVLIETPDAYGALATAFATQPELNSFTGYYLISTVAAQYPELDEERALGLLEKALVPTPQPGLILEPYNYTLEDVGDGWNEGKVYLAINNTSGGIITFQQLWFGDVYLETSEDITYTVQLFEDQHGGWGGSPREMDQINLYDLRYLLPGFRFRMDYTDSPFKSYHIEWRSAQAATPTGIVFPDYPELSFSLENVPEELLYPFDIQPSNYIKPISAIKDRYLSLPGQSEDIEITLTGNCFSRKSTYGEDVGYSLEYEAVNTNKFNESSVYPFPQTIDYFADGTYSFVSHEEEVVLGPDQSIIENWWFGYSSDYYDGYVALFWRDGQYTVLSLDECVELEE